MQHSSALAAGALHIARVRWASARFQSTSSILDHITSLQPYSLEAERPGLEPPQEWRDSWWKSKLLVLTGFYARKSQLAMGGELLYQAAAEQAENESLCKALALDKSQFMTGYTLASLHVWLLLRRLKAAGHEGKWVTQVMYDQFQRDTELRVHGIGIQLHLKKHLTHLEKVWYGTSIAYDRALSGDGPTLDECLLKNVYANDSFKYPYAQLLSHYLLHQERCLAMTDTDKVLLGQIRFSVQAAQQGTEGQSDGGRSEEEQAQQL